MKTIFIKIAVTERLPEKPNEITRRNYGEEGIRNKVK